MAHTYIEFYADDVHRFERIAKALERIADALEAANEATDSPITPPTIPSPDIPAGPKPPWQAPQPWRGIEATYEASRVTCEDSAVTCARSNCPVHG